MSTTSNSALIADYTRYMQSERNLSLNTVLAYESDLWQFAEVLALRCGPEQSGATLFTADTVHVSTHIHHLATHGISPKSRARKIASIRRFYDRLIKLELLEKDPTRLLVLPRQGKSLPKPIDPATMTEILTRAGHTADSAGASCYQIRDHAILELFYGAGVRISELCSLPQAGVNLKTGTAHVRGKGDKERIVPIGRAAVAAIENYLLVRPQLAKPSRGDKARAEKARALFISEQGTQITRQRVYAIVRAIGGPDIHPHRFRHSCATDMLRASNGELRLVQEQLGHESIATTQIYTQVTKDHLQTAHARFHPRG